MNDNLFNLIPLQTWLWIAGGVAFLVVHSIITMRQGVAVVKQWAEQNSFTLTDVKQRTFVPFTTPAKGQFYRIQVIDSIGQTKKGWLRFPEWSPRMKNVQVEWDK